MSWTYHQISGAIIPPKGSSPAGQGYSGFGPGRNNPSMEAHPNFGPIPVGLWKIVKPAYDDPHLGPIVMHLEPIGHNAHGRTLFRIHGDNPTGTASHGCIVQSHGVRQMIAASDDCELLVVQ